MSDNATCESLEHTNEEEIAEELLVEDIDAMDAIDVDLFELALIMQG